MQTPPVRLVMLLSVQARNVAKLSREYAKAILDGDEYRAHIIRTDEMPAAKSLARLVHK